MPANLENSAVATGLEKVSFHSVPKKGNAKECSNYRTIGLISHSSKVMLKILQARLQQYVNHELPDVQAGFRKGRGTRDKLPTSVGSERKQGNSRKTSTSFLLTILKPLTMWITINWKILKEVGIPDHLTCLLRICMLVKKQQLEPDMEQQNVSKFVKEYKKAVHCHPAHFLYMQSTSCEMQGWMTHKLESRLLGEISTIPDMHRILL